MEQVWQSLYNDIVAIINRGDGKSKQVFGRELIDLPDDELILYGSKLPYQDGTAEFTLTTNFAQPTFEWKAEITIKTPSKVEHYLLRPDRTIVETYGKNVYDVSLEKAQALQKQTASIALG